MLVEHDYLAVGYLQPCQRFLCEQANLKILTGRAVYDTFKAVIKVLDSLFFHVQSVRTIF